MSAKFPRGGSRTFFSSKSICDKCINRQVNAISAIQVQSLPIVIITTINTDISKFE